MGNSIQVATNRKAKRVAASKQKTQAKKETVSNNVRLQAAEETVQSVIGAMNTNFAAVQRGMQLTDWHINVMHLVLNAIACNNVVVDDNGINFKYYYELHQKNNAKEQDGESK